jgi:peptide-methionine (R)-S-oxide reductase
MVTRRDVLLATAGVAAVAAAGVGALKWYGSRATAATEGKFEVTKTPEEWRRILTPEQYAVLREQDTERPWTSPLNKEKRKGTFACAGCDLPLFESGTKFESGTGWPSFTQPFDPEHITELLDESHGMIRTEIRCRRCDSHLGHVFDDGPRPTRKRYCLNSVSMQFVPAGQEVIQVTQVT